MYTERARTRERGGERARVRVRACERASERERGGGERDRERDAHKKQMTSIGGVSEDGYLHSWLHVIWRCRYSCVRGGGWVGVYGCGWVGARVSVCVFAHATDTDDAVTPPTALSDCLGARAAKNRQQLKLGKGA